MRWISWLLLLSGCATLGTSAEWEFREFADLTKADLGKVQVAAAKGSSVNYKLTGGRTALCERSICLLTWTKPKLVLHRNGNEGKSVEQGKGTFTLDQVEAMELQAGLASAAASETKKFASRINNLGYECTPTSCRLTLFFYTDKNDEATEEQIIKSLLDGHYFKE